MTDTLWSKVSVIEGLPAAGTAHQGGEEAQRSRHSPGARSAKVLDDAFRRRRQARIGQDAVLGILELALFQRHLGRVLRRAGRDLRDEEVDTVEKLLDEYFSFQAG